MVGVVAILWSCVWWVWRKRYRNVVGICGRNIGTWRLVTQLYDVSVESTENCRSSLMRTLRDTYEEHQLVYRDSVASDDDDDDVPSDRWTKNGVENCKHVVLESSPRNEKKGSTRGWTWEDIRSPCSIPSHEQFPWYHWHNTSSRVCLVDPSGYENTICSRQYKNGWCNI